MKKSFAGIFNFTVGILARRYNAERPLSGENRSGSLSKLYQYSGLIWYDLVRGFHPVRTNESGPKPEFDDYLLQISWTKIEPPRIDLATRYNSERPLSNGNRSGEVLQIVPTFGPGLRIPTVKLKIPGKAFLKSESRTCVSFKL